MLPFAISPEAYQAWAAARQARRPAGQVIPTTIAVEGVAPGEGVRVAAQLKPHIGRPLDSDALDRDLLLLTGSGRYESATYRVDPSSGRPPAHRHLEGPAHGPPFLSLALDLQNTQSSSVSATVRGRMLFFDVAGRNSEARIDFSLGNTLVAAGEVHRPIGRSGLFVEPRAFAYRRDWPVFEDDIYIAEYREHHAGGSFDAGFSTAYRLEARMGYTAEHVHTNVRIGDADLPSVDGPQQTRRRG